MIACDSHVKFAYGKELRKISLESKKEREKELGFEGTFKEIGSVENFDFPYLEINFI